MSTSNGGDRFIPAATISSTDGPLLARAKSDLLSIAHDEAEAVTTRRAAMHAARNIAIVVRALDKDSLFRLRTRLVQLKASSDSQKETRAPRAKAAAK